MNHEMDQFSAIDRESSSPADPGADPGTGRQVVLVVCVVALAMLAIFGFRFLNGRRKMSALMEYTRIESDAPTGVDVVKVVRAKSTGILELPGSASPYYETTLFARTSGYLKDWKHDIGDRVKAGELLAVIETPELDDQLLAAQAKVVELKAEVKLAEAGAAFAKISFDRWNISGPDGVVSQQEKDEKNANLQSALAHVDGARASLQLGDAEVHRLETLEGFKRVTAPFDGVITQRQVDLGDLVTAGSTASTTPLFHIAQYDKVRVFVEIPQGISNQIYDGMPVTTYAPQNPEKSFRGKVDRTAGAIDPAGRMLRVEALVDNADLALLPGTYLQVVFQTDRKNPPLEIPAAAMTMRTSGPEVAVIGEDGTVKFHSIHIDKDLGDALEVDHGLAEGDRVALNVGENIVDGSHVEANESVAPAITRVPVASR